jgi:hypothetical protein
MNTIKQINGFEIKCSCLSVNKIISWLVEILVEYPKSRSTKFNLNHTGTHETLSLTVKNMTVSDALKIICEKFENNKEKRLRYYSYESKITELED